jgi:NADH-quinone oxidoreductase subunit H
MGLSLLGVLLLGTGEDGFGSLNLSDVVEVQAAHGVLGWNLFKAPLAFVLFTIAAFAETNRLPFDLPEAEPELVGGYHTEYSSIRFALFFMGEYAAMFVVSCLIVVLFLGGWHLPLIAEDVVVGPGGALLQVGAFLAKVGVLLFFFIQVRWTLPRLRYDQLMGLGWKLLLPLALVNLVVTGGLVAAGVF